MGTDLEKKLFFHTSTLRSLLTLSDFSDLCPHSLYNLHIVKEREKTTKTFNKHLEVYKMKQNLIDQ